MASSLLLITVFIIDLIAFALAVAAEQRKSKAHTQTDAADNAYCVYSSDISTGLGVGAFLFLLASQLLVMVASRCLCCGRGLKPGGSRTWAVMLFITCWVTFLIAEACLLAGSARNAYHTKYKSSLTSTSNLSCDTLRKGVFGAGAAFVVFTGIISQFYYTSYSKASSSFAPPHSNAPSVRMGPL